MEAGWDELLQNPEVFDGREVYLEGMIVGSIMEKLGSNPGVQATLSPHPVESRLAPIVDDMDAKVIVFLPGRLSDAQLQSLEYMKLDGSCLYVQGKFMYAPGEGDGYLGRIEAHSYTASRDQ